MLHCPFLVALVLRAYSDGGGWECPKCRTFLRQRASHWRVRHAYLHFARNRAYSVSVRFRPWRPVPIERAASGVAAVVAPVPLELAEQQEQGRASSGRRRLQSEL